MEHKLLITSTGRSGTTFVMLIYIFLGISTNYPENTYEENLKRFFVTNCGLEGDYTSKGYVIKNPQFMQKIDEITTQKIIDHIVFPYRDFEQSAKSREQISKRTPNGGLWNANSAEEQIQFYKKAFKQFLFAITRNRIPTTFLDFDILIHSPTYLYEKLKPTFPLPITEKEFILAYFQATDVNQRKPPRTSLN